MAVRFVIDQMNVSSEEFDSETVCVNFATGNYFGLRGAAASILDAFASPRTEDEAVELVVRHFQIDAAQVDTEIRQFIARLIGEKLLIEDQDQSDATHEATGLARQVSYEAPQIEIYSDLNELIMLDPVHEIDREHGWPLRRGDRNG